MVKKRIIHIHSSTGRTDSIESPSGFRWENKPFWTCYDKALVYTLLATLLAKLLGHPCSGWLRTAFPWPVHKSRNEQGIRIPKEKATSCQRVTSPIFSLSSSCVDQVVGTLNKEAITSLFPLYPQWYTIFACLSQAALMAKYPSQMFLVKSICSPNKCNKWLTHPFIPNVLRKNLLEKFMDIYLVGGFNHLDDNY